MTAPGKKAKKNSHLWVRDPDDWYVEPPWCARRLFEIENLSFGTNGGIAMDGNLAIRQHKPTADVTILDPSCGMGRIVVAAHAAGYDAYGSDIKLRWCASAEAMAIEGRFELRDFLDGDLRAEGVDWIVSNPPFKHCGMRPGGPPPPYVVKALEVAEIGCALLLPLDWIAGGTRSKWLATAGLCKVLVIAPRPSMPPGAVILAGDSPGGGEEDFAWFIFRKGHTGPWTGGWCDHQPPRAPVAAPIKPSPSLDPEQRELANAVAALEGR